MARSGTTFQAFWHGPEMTELHFAALRSFIDHGHNVDLYSYDDRAVPDGVTLRDATEVLPREELFFFNNPQTDVPDLGPFSDLFRFKLLSDRGGWYVDVDTFCMSDDIPPVEKAWARQNPKVSMSAVGTGQIALPAGSALARTLFERCRAASRGEYDREAIGPHLLTNLIGEAGLPPDMNGSFETFYPVEWIRIFMLWLPEFRGDMDFATRRAKFLPYYQSFGRYLGFIDAGRPPQGSFLRELFDRHASTPSVMPDLDPQSVRDAVVRWFDVNSLWSADEFRVVTGDQLLHILRSRTTAPVDTSPQTSSATPEEAEQGASHSMAEGLEGALGKIDDAILSLFRERERLVSTITEQAASQASLAPFIVPFAVGAPRRIRAFEELAPGFWIGFPNTHNPAINLTQVAESNPLLAPPDHHYSLRVEIEDPAGSPWITLEELVDRTEARSPYRVTIAVKAKASRRFPVRFELSVPQTDGGDYRFFLGTLTLGQSYEPVFISQVVNLAEVPSPNLGTRAKLLAFLPTDAPLSCSIAYLRILLARFSQ